jgi:hypothetical protein
MPSTSKKQHNFMAAVANNPSLAKKVGVPQSVGKEFSNADKNRKFSKGGDTMASKMNPGFMAMMAKKKGATKMAGGGMPMKDGKPAFIGDGKGAMKKGGMAEGGKSDIKQDKGMMQKAVNKHEGRLHKGAAMTKLSKGGGIESKGKTKGKMVKMNMGGRAC